MDTTTNDVDLLRDEIATLRKEMEVLRGQAPVARATTPTAAAAVDEEAPQSNRRGFLKLAGAAAAGATAVAVVGSTQQAAAATNGNMLIGNSNTTTAVNDTTSLYCPSGVTLSDQTFRCNNYSNLSITLPADHRIAVAGTTSGNDNSNGVRTGVYGRTLSPAGQGGQGVFGSAGGGSENTFLGSFSFGVVGTAPTGGFGMYGTANTGAGSTGVKGRADEGTGVAAASTTGISLHVQDGGRILQALRSPGAPAAGSFAIGEQIRDGNGDMYICTASGAPGTWRKVTAQAPGYANAGGSINLLPQPIRLLDTRPSTAAPLNNGFAKVAGNTTLTIQITGTAVGGVSVPAGAKGVIGNITIIAPSGDGYAQVWPSGAPPTTSNINYGTISANPAIANSFVVALDATGKINILTYQTAHVLIDVAGFVF